MDKEALAREAQALLSNQTLQRALAKIEADATEAMINATTDDDRRKGADTVRIARSLPDLLRQSVENGQPPKLKSVV